MRDELSMGRDGEQLQGWMESRDQGWMESREQGCRAAPGLQGSPRMGIRTGVVPCS